MVDSILLRTLLWPISILYGFIIKLRNYAYNHNWFKVNRLPCKVISVGNITMGGTGKTPTVIALATFLQTQNVQVAVLSRGYGRKSKNTLEVSDGKTVHFSWETGGDEPVLMAKALNGIPVVVDENRYRGGQYLVIKFNPQVIILDDGFQHRSIHRDLDIVLINSGDKIQNYSLFPRGRLRENWQQIHRADLIILTKINLYTPSNELVDLLESTAISMFRSNMEIDSKRVNDNQLSTSKSAFLVTGIGDNEGFRKTVESMNIQIVGELTYRDHHAYTEKDVKTIASVFKDSKANVILTTEKDMIKLSGLQKQGLPVYAIPIKVGIEKDGMDRILAPVLTPVI